MPFGGILTHTVACADKRPAVEILRDGSTREEFAHETSPKLVCQGELRQEQKEKKEKGQS